MPNLLDTAATWLVGQLQEHAGRDVVYRRGALEIECTGIPGRSEFEVEDTSGATILVQSYDWSFATADLAFGGVALIPQRGDEVVETDADGVVRTYAILEANGVQAYRADPARSAIRVHTKLRERREP